MTTLSIGHLVDIYRECERSKALLQKAVRPTSLQTPTLYKQLNPWHKQRPKNVTRLNFCGVVLMEYVDCNWAEE